MTIVMLAAGTSSRMGEQNKMLLSYNKMPMIAHCCMQALEYLETLSSQGTIVVVTGFMQDEIEHALQPCLEYAKASKANIKIVLTHNTDFEKGQYSSTVCAVKAVEQDEDFFIALADMPFVKQKNYETLVPLLKDHDAVRPFTTNEANGSKEPGHPVLLSRKMKKAIENNPEIGSVNRLLKNYDVYEVLFNDTSWTFDVDTPQAYKTLSM